MPITVLTSTATRDSEGHLVVVRLPAGSAVVMRHSDGVRQDISRWAADLLLLGMQQASAAERGEVAEPAETTSLGDVVLETSMPTEASSFTYLHLPTGDWVDFTLGDALAAIARGVAEQVTAGVAREAVEESGVPDSPAQLDVPPRD